MKINSTFNIPDAESRSFVYSRDIDFLGEKSDGFAPNITGYAKFGGVLNHTYDVAINVVSGAFNKEGTEDVADFGTTYISGCAGRLTFDASACSNVYKNVSYIRPKNIVVSAIIKY